MKLRGPYRFKRHWLAIAAVLLGVLAGYVVGRQSILHLTESRMEAYADSILDRENEVGDEITGVFQQANSAANEVCSDEDIGLLRRLTFGARFLKDVGRVENSLFLCSATAGRLKAPEKMLAPDVLLPSDMRFYGHYPLYHSNDSAAIVATGRADVVVSPDVLMGFTQDPFAFAVRVVDPTKEMQKLPVAGDSSLFHAYLRPGSAGRQVVQQNGVLKVDRYSGRFPLCVTVSMPEKNVLAKTRGRCFTVMLRRAGRRDFPVDWWCC